MALYWIELAPSFNHAPSSIHSFVLTRLASLAARLSPQVNSKPGDRILIHAGSGGLGSFAIQWAAKVLGLNVSATASAKNLEFLRSLGAQTAIDYRSKTGNWDDDEPSYDIILDPMSYAYEPRVVRRGKERSDDMGGAT